MTVLSPPTDHLPIRPWPDVLIDAHGHDPRSEYVETYWLGILGPSTTWFLRRLVAGLEAEPSGYELDLSDTARCLGLGDKGGRHSPFMRSMGRLVQFDLAQAQEDPVLVVRRKVPPLNRRQIVRLPTSLQTTHQALLDEQLQVSKVEHLRQRSRRLALSLLELGEDLQTAERQLLRWKFHPALARESAAWAWKHHREAQRAAVDTAVGLPASVSPPASRTP